MVNPEEFKRKIEELILQDYKVEFLGENFDEIALLLTETKTGKIYRWIEGVVRKKVQPIYIGSRRKYKDWAISQLLTFRYPFSIGNSEYRILFVKVKNSIYIEFHLGDHKYYDKVRKDLDLKRSGY